MLEHFNFFAKCSIVDHKYLPLGYKIRSQEFTDPMLLSYSSK